MRGGMRPRCGKSEISRKAAKEQSRNAQRVPAFPTTIISMVRAAAARGSDAKSRDALEKLCGIYWYPLYGFVRRQGYGVDESQDLTQAFIARLIEKNALRHFQQERGRFRSF